MHPMRRSLISGVCLVLLTGLLGGLIMREAGRQVIDPLGAVRGWSHLRLRMFSASHQAVLRLTRGKPLPQNARGIWACNGALSPDHKCYLVFGTDSAGLQSFVLAVTGRPLDELSDESKSVKVYLDCEKRCRDRGMPWKVDEIKNGRYVRPPASNGFLAVDLDRNIVYLEI